MRQPKKFTPHPFAYHEEVEVEISALSNLGVGIARVSLPENALTPVSLPGIKQKTELDEPDSDKSWVVFVPHTLPGEKVIARIYRNDKSHSQAAVSYTHLTLPTIYSV